MSEHVANVAALIKSGKLWDAKRETARLLDNVHPQVLAVLQECADALTRSNTVARPKLVALWQRSDETGRKVIEACAPARDEWEHRQIPQPPADDRPRAAARPDSPVETRRSRPVSRQELRQRRRYTKARKDTAAYYDEKTGRFGVDDQPQRGDRPDAYALDYDKAALHAVRGLDCVACWIERTRTDHAPNVRHGDVFDDGLCTECRERGRAGIPSVTGPFTVADELTARCEFIATRHHPATTRTLLTRDWEALSPRVRVHMKTWIEANRDVINAAAQGSQTPDVDPCACGSRRQVRNGQCADCRQLETDQPQPPTTPAPAVPVSASRRYQRRHGQALPPNAVYVGRPTRFGNPFRCDPTPAARADAVRQYRQWISARPELIEQARAELTGRTLACWCPLDGPCHADVLIELIDAPATRAA